MRRPSEAERLRDDNIDLLGQWTDKELLAIAKPLVQLILEVCDDIASGHNTWMTFGATEKKTAFVISSKQLTGSIDIYAKDALSLLLQVPELL